MWQNENSGNHRCDGFVLHDKNSVLHVVRISLEQGFYHQSIKSFQTCETFQESHKNLRALLHLALSF